jgi:hypothetical protein
LRLALLLLGGGLAVAGVLAAQEARGPGPETEAEAAKGEAVKRPPAAEADATEKTPPPKGPSPNRFEPTEKVRADFDVSFPIDI